MMMILLFDGDVDSTLILLKEPTVDHWKNILERKVKRDG